MPKGQIEAIVEEGRTPMSDSAQLAQFPHPLGQVSIEPAKRWVSVNFRELWDAREVLYYLTWRDIKVRYKQSALGVAWVLLQPLLTMVIFSILFGRVAKMPSEGVPYPIFILTALIPWTLFQTSVSRGPFSLVSNRQLVQKVYLPRLSLPLSNVFGAVFDFAISLLLLVPALAWYHVKPSLQILYLPVFLAIALMASTGIVLWLSAANVRVRDIERAVPFLVQVWFYATPVAYPITIVRSKWRLLFGLNPMSGVAEGCRWALLGVKTSPWPLVGVSSAVAIVLLVTGALFFRKMEQTFADVV
jgi:homopolymeric O-antigen transport system permease protein